MIFSYILHFAFNTKIDLFVIMFYQQIRIYLLG